MSLNEEDQGDELLARAEELLQYDFDDVDDPHVEPLDDLQLRRRVDAVLEEVALAGPLPVRKNQGENFGKGSRRLRTISFAVAALFALAIVGVYFSMDSGEQKAVSILPSKPARILLASGVGGDMRVGDTISLGTSFVTNGGSIVISMGHDAKVLFGPGTEALIRTLDKNTAEVLLNEGTLFMSVAPGKRGREYIVQTSKGRVVVTGTVFQVTVNEDQATTSVFRGTVKTESEAGLVQMLTVAERVVMGSGQTEDLSQSEIDVLRSRSRLLDNLSTDHGTSLKVGSVPHGAPVVVDGMLMGETPFAMVLKPGHRELEISKDGYSPIVEQLSISPGQTPSRFFELKPVEDVSTTGKGLELQVPAAISVKEPVIGAGVILKQAQALRAQREWSAAADKYRELVKTHPSSSEATIARVSLASIQLEHLGQVNRALNNYRAYGKLAPGGALAPEATFGEARALRRLKRSSEEASVLQRFIDHYPDSFKIVEAKDRLAQIEAKENGIEQNAE